MCIRKPRYQIRSSRPAGHKADPGLSRGFCIALRRVDQSLLVAGKHKPDPLLSVELVEKVRHISSRIAENHLHAFLLQRLQKKSASRHVHNAISIKKINNSCLNNYSIFKT